MLTEFKQAIQLASLCQDTTLKEFVEELRMVIAHYLRRDRIIKKYATMKERRGLMRQK